METIWRIFVVTALALVAACFIYSYIYEILERSKRRHHKAKRDKET